MARLNSCSDGDLVGRALGGSEAAYRALVTRFERPVLTVILRLVRDRSVAEDLAQETFLKAFRHLDRFDRNRRLASWLFTIAHNTALDHLRRRRPHAVSVSTGGESAPEDDEMVLPAPWSEAPDLAAASSELRAAVDAAIASLRPAYRQVLLLRFEDGLAYDEIAEAMDQPMGTVKIHLHRARKQLAARLEAAGFDMAASSGGQSRRPRVAVATGETPRTAPA